MRGPETDRLLQAVRAAVVEARRGGVTVRACIWDATVAAVDGESRSWPSKEARRTAEAACRAVDPPTVDAEVAGLRAQVAAARAFAVEMRGYCSPHGVSALYADRLDERLDAASARLVVQPDAGGSAGGQTAPDEVCGAEPPGDGRWGDCWCTLRPGHGGEHRCEPCTERHGAPGWADGSGR